MSNWKNILNVDPNTDSRVIRAFDKFFSTTTGTNILQDIQKWLEEDKERSFGISSLPNGEIGYAGGTSNHHNINIDVRLLDAGIYYRVSANSKGSGIQKAKMNEEEFDVARLSLDRVATHEALHFRYKYGQHYNVINETNKLLSAEPARNPLYLGEELIRVNNEWQRQYDYIYDNGWKKRSSGELLEQNNSESLGLGYQPQHVSASDLATFAPSLSVHDLSTRNREHG